MSIRLIRLLLIGLALIAMILYGYVALSRIGYPYELEWMEGATVSTFTRVLDGGMLYTVPTVDYIPPIYGPAYFYLGAIFPLLFGVNLFAVRLLSLIASIGVLALLYHWIRREGGDPASALSASGLFAASFAALGSWFDLARVDMLYLLFLLLGGYWLRFAVNWRALVLSAVFLSLATFVKANGAVVIALLMPFALVVYRRRIWVWLGALALIGGGVTLGFTLMSGEWFLYWVLARSQDAVAPLQDWLVFWTADLPRLWLALLLAIYALVAFARSRQSTAFRFYVYFTLGMVFAAWVSRIHHGSWVNVDFSAYAALILLAVVGLSRLLTLLGQATRSWRSFGCALLAILIMAQCWGLRYDVAKQQPTAADQAAGANFIARLSRVAGEVLLFGHGVYPRLAGVPAAQSGWLMNMMHGGRSGAKVVFDDSVRAAIETKRFAVIVTDNAAFLHENYLDVLAANYSAQVIDFGPDVFVPVTGAPYRPLLWWTPR